MNRYIAPLALLILALAAPATAKAGAIVASSSAFNSTALAGSGTATPPGTGTNLTGDPQLGGDFAPLPGSPLIDRGDPAAAYSGELDINANARSQDGTGDCVAIPDIGAFELASRYPKAAGSRRAQALQGLALAQALHRAQAGPQGPQARRDAQLHAQRGGTRDGRGRAQVNGNLAGKTLKPGSYRLKLTAVDGAGLHSKPRALTFKVLRP